MSTVTEESSVSDIIDAKADIKLTLNDLNAEVKVLKEREDLLDFFLMKRMDADGLSLTRNDRARVSIVESTKPKVEDWDAFHQYIKDNNAFELLNRAANAKSYKDALEIGLEIPGVTPYVMRRINFSSK